MALHMLYLASFYRIFFNNWFHLITLKTGSLNRMYNFTDNREIIIRGLESLKICTLTRSSPNLAFTLVKQKQTETSKSFT